MATKHSEQERRERWYRDILLEGYGGAEGTGDAPSSIPSSGPGGDGGSME